MNEIEAMVQAFFNWVDSGEPVDSLNSELDRICNNQIELFKEG